MDGPLVERLIWKKKHVSHFAYLGILVNQMQLIGEKVQKSLNQALKHGNNTILSLLQNLMEQTLL